MKRKEDSFIQAISIAPLQVRYYSEALPTQTDTMPELTKGNGKGIRG